MDLYTILQEVKEYGAECVWKNGKECLTAPDNVILMYLKTLLNEQEFIVVLRHKKLIIEEFRKSVEEELEWLNS